MFHLIFFLITIFASTQQTSAKLLIISPVYNRPDFIEMQHKTFQKFLKDDYELVLFNDANNTDIQHAIEATCERLEIRCIRMPQELHNVDPLCDKAPASFRHGEVLQYAFETIGFKHDDIVMLIDSDVFLIKEFSAREFLAAYDLYIINSANGAILPQLCFINMPHLKNPETLNFRASFINGSFMETGQNTKKYITSHPDLKCLAGNILWGLEFLGFDRNKNLVNQLNTINLHDKGYLTSEINLIKSLFEIADAAARKTNINYFYDVDIGFFETNTFLDYKHGSGWHGPRMNITKQKDIVIKKFIDSIVG